jgi:hypothetical protein
MQRNKYSILSGMKHLYFPSAMAHFLPLLPGGWVGVGYTLRKRVDTEDTSNQWWHYAIFNTNLIVNGNIRVRKRCRRIFTVFSNLKGICM